MPSTYTTNLGIEKIATGEQSGTWGNTTNTNLDILDQSIDGIISITLVSAGSSGSPNSLPITDGAVSNGRNKFIEFVDGGDLGATAYVQLTPNDSEKIVHIRNSLSASRSIIVFQGTYNASNDYEILNGEDVLLKFDGAGAGAVVSQVFANLALPSVNIDGGTIDGAVIGGASAAAGSFTTLSASSPISAADGSASTPSVTNTGDTNTGIFFPAADTVGVAVGGTEIWRYGSNPTTAKNLIMNGSMTVAQRGTVTSPADLAYTLDGWQTRDNVGATITVSQDTTGIFAGIGGSPTCMKIDCTAAEASVAASEFYVIRQKIETQNCDFLNYGQADALPVTLSFNIQSPKSGTHTGVLGNNAASSRSYAFNFTVASADTPERVSVTIPGDTAGSAIGQGATTEGLRLNIPLLCGADNAKAAGSWGANIYEAGSGTPNLLDSTANNIYLGDVQLEVGSVATDFEHEDIGETWRKCIRYLRRRNQVNGQNIVVGSGFVETTTRVRVNTPFFGIPMRAGPTLSTGGTLTDFNAFHGGTSNTLTGTATNTGSDIFNQSFTMVVPSGTPFTVGQGCQVVIASGTNGTYIQHSAEL
jgi:hypothetical protein